MKPRLYYATGLFLAWTVVLLVDGPARAQQGDRLRFPERVEASSEGEGEDEIETDRDSFTPATTTAGRGRVIVEGAYSFIDNRAVPETHSFPELITRVGVCDWLELRFGWNYEVGGAGNPVSGNVPSDLPDEAALERESRVLYGLKASMTGQDRWIPESALIVQGYTPTSGEATDTHVSTSYVFGWTLPNRWTWDSAVRYGTESLKEDRFNVWASSTVLKVPIGRRWKAHAEFFSIYTDGLENESVQHFFSPGAHFLVTPDFEVGVRIGWGLNRDAPDFFSNVGFGWRF